MESSSASPSLRYLKSNNISEVSLIDMDDSQLKQVKPKLRQIQHLKRVGSSTHNPSQFSLQEEVIDFASDDENPDNGSHMSRLKIRSSLKSLARAVGQENIREQKVVVPTLKAAIVFGGN